MYVGASITLADSTWGKTAVFFVLFFQPITTVPKKTGANSSPHSHLPSLKHASPPDENSHVYNKMFE